MALDKDWRPSASLQALQQRADLYRRIRTFMDARGILEVQTPCLASHTVTDPHIDSLAVVSGGFLQTSPEYAMKRLLASGSGSIYQITPAFRQGESGRRHNPEFTLLEYYRSGFDHRALMDELSELLVSLNPDWQPETRTYRDAFMDLAAVDPVSASNEQLLAACQSCCEDLSGIGDDRATLQDLLFSHKVAPQLGQPVPTFLTDYPAAQAALARIRDEQPAVAERFEVFINGIEIMNGFHELNDAGEQAQRFEQDRRRRCDMGLPDREPDPGLLAALGEGLPDCAGVAVGLDRLLMVLHGYTSLDEVLAFPASRA